MSIYKQKLDYDLIHTYELKDLKESHVIPFSKIGIYLNCFTCDFSNLDSLKISSLVKESKISKNDIEFFLANFRKSYTLNKKLRHLHEDVNSENRYLEEFFDILLKDAISLNASDIHLECLENNFLIRFRIDGRLKIFYAFNKEYFSSVSSYIKMQAKLDITQIRLPQDGRFNFFIKKEKYDFRISTLPTISGESLVLRILDNKNVKKDIEDLGFSKHLKDEFENICALTQGLVLVTGPTGSGKTTTLYSLLKKLNNENKKIITIEDPVEYKISQVQQVLVNDSIGLSFDTVLRNILRQDPDIILIGEIRDKASLEVALQASLTGHLVLASIHANNSLETISRLIDLNADLYLLSTTLKYILSQRLVLNICKNCDTYGCKMCNFIGFKNRTCIAEVLKIDSTISSMILKKDDPELLRTYLENKGFISLLEDGKEKVKNKTTTLDEVLKVINT